MVKAESFVKAGGFDEEHWSKRTAVELGAGTGLLGIVVAKLGARVCFLSSLKIS